MQVKRKLKEEAFPQLPIRKQEECTSTSRRSSISSISSTSICLNEGSTEFDLKQTISASKALVQDAVCRQRMFCKCQECKQHVGLLKKRKWNNLSRYPCKNAFSLEENDVVKIKWMRNYGKKGPLMVFVFVVEPETRCDQQGWIHPDALGGVEAVRSALREKETALTVRSLKKSFRNHSRQQNRTPVKTTATFVTEPAVIPTYQSQYQFNEMVLARDALGHRWYRAEVVATNPLELKSSGWEGTRLFDERNVKKFPASKFVAVQSITVRTQRHVKSFVKNTLPKGTVLDVVQMDGEFARITSPECGWVQMRTPHKLFAIEENYQFKLTYPRMFLGGLSLETNSSDIAMALQKVNGVVLISKIERFVSGDSLCAYVHLKKPSDYRKLAGQKIIAREREISCELCINYLRCKAALELRI